MEVPPCVTRGRACRVQRRSAVVAKTFDEHDSASIVVNWIVPSMETCGRPSAGSGDQCSAARWQDRRDRPLACNAWFDQFGLTEARRHRGRIRVRR